jgi:hypothetical protein
MYTNLLSTDFYELGYPLTELIWPQEYLVPVFILEVTGNKKTEEKSAPVKT